MIDMTQRGMLFEKQIRQNISTYGKGPLLTHQGDPEGVTSLVARGTAAPVFARSGTRRVRRYVAGAYGYYEVADGVVPAGINGNGDPVIDCDESGANYCLHVADMNSWGKVNCTTPSSIAGPIDGIVAYAFVENTGSAISHYVSGSLNALGDTTGQTVWASFIIAAGSRNWVLLQTNLGGAAVIYYYFNIDTEEFIQYFGTMLDSNVETIGTFGGKMFKRVSMKFLSNKGAGDAYLIIFPANNTPNYVYAGDGSTCFYLAHVQLEIGANLKAPSSPIITTTATVVRNADDFYYVGDDGNLGGVGSDKRGTLRFTTFEGNWTLGANRTLFSINDGGSAADEILVTATSTTGDVFATITATGGTPRTVAGPAIDVLDGDAAGHVIQLSYQAGRAILWVDGTAGVTTTTLAEADIPDNLDRMKYGYIPIGDERFYNPPKWSYIA